MYMHYIRTTYSVRNLREVNIPIPHNIIHAHVDSPYLGYLKKIAATLLHPLSPSLTAVRYSGVLYRKP